MNQGLIQELKDIHRRFSLTDIVYNLSFVAGNEEEEAQNVNNLKEAEKYFDAEKILETAARHLADKKV